jgi:hypothetical protein
MNIYQFRQQLKEAKKMELENMIIKVGIIKTKRTVKDLYYECVIKPNREVK